MDLRKTLKHLYSASASPVLVDVPEMTYLMVDGEGDPNLSQGFQEAMGVLYGVAYTSKFMMKKRAEDPYDFAVMMPEGLWWSPSGANPYDEPKANWRWTLMLAVPPTITEKEFGEHVGSFVRGKTRRAWMGFAWGDFARASMPRQCMSARTLIKRQRSRNCTRS